MISLLLLVLLSLHAVEGECAIQTVSLAVEVYSRLLY